MSSVVISGDTSGSITIAAPAVSGTTTLTLPATSGTVLTSATTQAGLPPNIAGNGPAFIAYSSGATSLTNSAFTKILYATKLYDTNNNYDTTLSRFTPTVAGYYQISAHTESGAGMGTNTVICIYQNGSEYFRGMGSITSTPTYYTVSGLVYCNGSTDYIEIYLYQSSGSTQTTNAATYNKFSGFLARSA